MCSLGQGHAPTFSGQENLVGDISPCPSFGETQGNARGMFPKKQGKFAFWGGDLGNPLQKGLLGMPPWFFPNGLKQSQFFRLVIVSHIFIFNTFLRFQMGSPMSGTSMFTMMFPKIWRVSPHVPCACVSIPTPPGPKTW